MDEKRETIDEQRTTSKQQRYDAIIVGARAAGAVMAALLAQENFRVLLVDRVTFPKTTLSCPITFGNTFDVLKRIGVLEKVEAIGAPKLRLYQTQIGNVRLYGRMLPYAGFDYAYQIRRELYDDVIFNHVAQMPNVETRLGFNVTDLIWENERVVGVRGSEGGGQPQEIRADAVIGADGIFSTIAEKVNAKKYNIIAGHTCIYFAYYEDVKPAANEPTATIYYDADEHFAFVTANSDGDLTVISISLPASQFERVRQNFENVHFEYAQKIPEMAERMRDAKRVTPVYGVSPRDSFYREPFGNGWVLIGDAAYYKDPLPGQGIHDALRSAELATQALVEYRAQGKGTRAWNDAFAIYHQTRDRETKAMYELTDFYADLERKRLPQEMDLFRAIASSPKWSNIYVSMFNGVTSVSWFRRFDTVMRILLEWRWQQLRDKLLGRRAIENRSTELQSATTSPSRPTATRLQ